MPKLRVVIPLLIVFALLSLYDTEVACFFSGMIPAFTIHHNTTFNYTDIPDGSLNSKVALVTGANSGLGFWNAYHLAKRGATVALACRTLTKCQTAIKEIKSKLGNQKSDLVPFQVNLGNLSSVAAFTKEFKQKFKRLDIFLQNAGMGVSSWVLSPDGIESLFATNHLGHFKITKDLQSLLIQTSEEFGPVTVVMTSSNMHYVTVPEGIRLNETALNSPETYDSSLYYGMSKLANVLFAQELAFRLKDKKNIYVNSCHPGLVRTNILTTALAERNLSDFDRVSMGIFVDYFYQVAWTPEEGAFTQFYLGTAFDFLKKNDVRGRYFHPQMFEVRPSHHARNLTLQKGLWDFSEKLLVDRGF